ncbi:hypothetical protein [Vibrio owensii]|uniref:hypothetical protein n=1 Tax=Vibrio owensii TaxID=696485 RepID=UPI0018F163F5|nr:hypothetical protein [Vibrio owensii]
MDTLDFDTKLLQLELNVAQTGKRLAFERSERTRQRNEETFNSHIKQSETAHEQDLEFQRRCRAFIRESLGYTKQRFNKAYISKSWIRNRKRLDNYTNDQTVQELFRITIMSPKMGRRAYLFRPNGELFCIHNIDSNNTKK